ncbi:MAG: ankyrin repeat domain-containing protein [Legionella sp.]|uniref:ankyrin repeat domain-containing protein n=1 Tax=Legionella sp. TaxID=459 RepID=UPI0028439B09|nr:ankyrin repeat domain-containing protein [Legionella sp.]
MQEKRIREAIGNVEKYLVHSGIRHHFEEHGIFSHIDLEMEIQRIITENEVGQNTSEQPLGQKHKINVSECLDALCSTDYETIVEYAFLDLFKLMNFTGVSQARIIDNVRKYQQLIGTAEEDLLSSKGQCGGIALAYIAAELDKGALQTPSQLQYFEQFLSRIARWDGESVADASLKNDMEFFIERVGALQEEQFNPFPVFKDMLGSNNILTNLSLSWVHNQYTLDFILKEVYKTQPQLIYTSADHHASMIQPLSANEILYFNPNQQFGSMRLKVDDTFYDLFCGGLSTGHSNTYIDRMPLSLECFSSNNREMNLETILDRLINITIEHDFDTRLLSMSLEAAVKIVVNRQGSNGRTALMEAVIHGNLAEVRLLLNKYGADPRLIDIQHNDALRYAIIYGHEDIALEILNHKEMTKVNKAADGMTYLHSALLRKQLDVVNKLLLTEDIQLNTQSKDKTFSGFTPLHFAILKGLDDVCERLINNGDVLLNTAEKNSGMTPLHLAIDQHNPRVVNLLLKQERVNINKCSTQVDEDHPQGFSAFVYLAKEFSYLDSDESDYPEACSALVDIYEQLIKANASQDGLTSEDRLYLFVHLIKHDEHYANDLLHDIRQGLITLENNELCINLVDYLISHEDIELNENDYNLLEFYLTYSSEIDLEAIEWYQHSTPQLISRLSETNQQKLIALISEAQAEEHSQSQSVQPNVQSLREENHRPSHLVSQSFFQPSPPKTTSYSNVALLTLIGFASIGTIMLQYPAILNAFLGQPNIEGMNQNQEGGLGL